MQVTVWVGGQVLPMQAIEDWELKRTVHVALFLQSRLKLPVKDITRDEKGQLRNMAAIRADLTKIKIAAGINKLRSILDASIALSTLSVKFLNFLSRGKRKSSVVEIAVEGCTAEEMRDRYFRLMLKNSSKNLEHCLSANPDHYVLVGCGENVQEVIETTGGSPLPTQFYIYYGDDQGLTSTPDKSYPCQAAGICCLRDDTLIGGVRHQMRNEGNGLRAKLEVEFPSVLTKRMISEHQLHLACEFTNWFINLANDPNI